MNIFLNGKKALNKIQHLFWTARGSHEWTLTYYEYFLKMIKSHLIQKPVSSPEKLRHSRSIFAKARNKTVRLLPPRKSNIVEISPQN